MPHIPHPPFCSGQRIRPWGILSHFSEKEQGFSTEKGRYRPLPAYFLFFRKCYSLFDDTCAKKRKNPAAQRPDSFFLYKYKTHFFLVMEQTDSCKCHRHVVLVAALDDSVVTNRSARLCDVLDAALVCALDVVAEREEGIGT